MLRIDSEIIHNLGDTDSQKLIDRTTELLRDANVLIFEDYDKGVLDERNIREITKNAHDLNVPVAVDPKKRNFLSYKGVTLFKPNLKELKEGFHRDVDISNRPQFEQVVKDLMKEMKLKNLFVTMSEHGVMITDGTHFEYVPAHLRKIADVSGAGDTVISVASLCLALKLPNRHIAELANLAGGLVCEEVGVVPVNRERLMNEAAELAENG
jgi:rfaE bifunctional protein kinase chain/domain